MKRLSAAVMALALLLSPLAALAQSAEKLDRLPEIFVVETETVERMINDGRSVVKKEYLQTANAEVNAALKAIADDYDTALSSALTPMIHPKKNSRLDINTVYYRTGQSWLSTMTLARVSIGRVQEQSPFTTRTFDLENGQRITLKDVFPESSAAWGLLAQRVKSHIQTLFPNDPQNTAALNALCQRESLEKADFTLSAMELTLHYPASLVFEGRTGLIHVRFFYPELEGMMTEAAARQTDNSRWKMVAITCDDGPSYAESAQALDAFRAAGARVSYFIVGKKLEEYGDILMREFDENQLIGCHTYHHWSGYSIKIMANRLKELDMTNDLLYNLSGEAVRYFRAPGGTYPPWVECGIGLPIIQWSVDTYDYTGKAPKKIFYSVRNNVKDGDIILMHDSGLQMYKSIPLIAQYLTDNGYMMVTLDELAAYQGVTLKPNGVYHRLDDVQP